MTNAPSRAAPSGKLAQPLVSKGPFAWDATSPLVIELLAAGHASGIYEIAQTFFVRTMPAALSLLTSIGWNQPRFGAATLDINFASIVSNPNVNALRSIESTGLGAITLTLTPSGLSGTASVEVACLALREAFAFP